MTTSAIATGSLQRRLHLSFPLGPLGPNCSGFFFLFQALCFLLFVKEPFGQLAQCGNQQEQACRLTQDHFWRAVVPSGHNSGVMLMVKSGTSKICHPDTGVPDTFLFTVLQGRREDAGPVIAFSKMGYSQGNVL